MLAKEKIHTARILLQAAGILLQTAGNELNVLTYFIDDGKILAITKEMAEAVRHQASRLAELEGELK